MRILIADRLEASAVADLESDGHECVVEPDLTPELLPERIPGFDALLVRSTKVTAPTFAAADRLRLVVRAGAGTNTIDKAAATDAGAVVANVPGRNAVAVAELTFGLMLALDRRIPDAVIALRDGQWNKKGLAAEARGLYGRDIGIVGLGSIGLAVAERAHAFGMSVWGLERTDRSAETQARIDGLGMKLVGTLPELAGRVDVLTLHIPGGSGTVGVVDEKTLTELRPGSMLINTSRADVVDNDALLTALDSGRIRAGLDVFPDEPSSGTAAWNSRLASHPAVVGTHHFGASTEQAQLAVAVGVVDVVRAFVSGVPVHVVNPEVLSVEGSTG